MISAARWVVVVGVGIGAAGCLRDRLVECGDGRLCPVATICDDVHGLCLDPAQTSCGGVEAGAQCSAGDFVGICTDGYCLPGCGDGVLAVGEDCDDGNFASHDGCSSTCQAEAAVWRTWQSPWQGRVSHSSAVFRQPTSSAPDSLLIFGGRTSTGVQNDMWIRTTEWAHVATPIPARATAAMDFDSDRDRVVLYGGDTGADVGGSSLDDTWEYDGTTWTEMTPAVTPGGRVSPAMAYDPVAKHMVLFGGKMGSTFFDETWVYDGTTWAKLDLATHPPARSRAAMVWDDALQGMVLFGGSDGMRLGDTWQLKNGAWTEWTQATPRPVDRFDPSLAYFPATQKVVLFGGNAGEVAADTWEFDDVNGWVPVQPTQYNPPGRSASSLDFSPADNGLLAIGGTPGGGDVPLDDVWRLDKGGRWHDMSPEFSPSDRDTRIAYAASRAAVVLVGTSGQIGDTWTFDGAGWTKIGDADLPATRELDAIAYDSALDEVVIFGGSRGSTRLAETAILTSGDTTWNALVLPQEPPPQSLGAFEFDEADNVCVLFGGQTTGVTLDTTWLFDGTQWTLVPADVHPNAQAEAAMGYDRLGQRIVLFDDQGQTWTYANQIWTNLGIDGPPARTRGHLVWHEGRQRLLLLGGNAADGSWLQDLWELDGTSWREWTITLAPPTRLSAGVAPHPPSRSIVLYGGRNIGGGFLGDTWQLRFSSSTPDEDCANGTDDDGDQHVDQADPDCQ